MEEILSRVQFQVLRFQVLATLRFQVLFQVLHGESSLQGAGDSSLPSGSSEVVQVCSTSHTSMQYVHARTLLQKLVDQLTDNSLLRLWKTGGDISQLTAEDDDCDEDMVG